MCGIAGFTLSSEDISYNHRATIVAMLNRIAYRGPDQQGIKIFDHIVLGHNRLTIMEPEGGAQPRVHKGTGNSLVYNGELYGHRAFDGEILSAGGQFRDHCDTETLFWLIEIYGLDQALSRIDGMFAFAYYQAEENTLSLVRDRFGQKPLYYADINGELVFASEIKALRQHPALANVTADENALSLYLMMEYVPWPATGISQIHALPPGHILHYQNGQVHVSPYWRISEIRRETVIDEQLAVKKLDQKLNQAVQQQLVADVPVGVFLSGGLDSSLVAAIAKHHRTDIATFTIKFPQSSFDESFYAEEVAQLIGTRHTTIELDRQSCLDGITELVDNMDQPFADSSQLPTYLLCKATKPHVRVALGGDAADELFLGYPNFNVLRFSTLLAKLPSALGQFGRKLLGLLPATDTYMSRAFLLRQLSYSFGKPANMQSIFWMAAVAPLDQENLWVKDQGYEQKVFDLIRAQMTSTELPLMEQCQRHFLTQYLSQDILHKTDRASMLNSFEVRSPFLTSDVAEYALTLPCSALIQQAHGKRILKMVANAYLPKKIVYRKKHGFASPVSVLIKQDFRDIVEVFLMDKTNPMYQYLSFNQVKAHWEQHNIGQQDRGKMLWTLFMLAAFFKNQF